MNRTPQPNRERDIVVAALRHAAPYIRLYKHKLFVIKAGGELFLDARKTAALLEQMAILHQVGVQLLLVHGAGPQSTQRAASQGLTTTMIEGRRVTDAATLAVSEAVNREIGAEIAATCANYGLETEPMLGAAGPVQAKQRAPVEVAGQGLVDYGFVGDITGIDTEQVAAALRAGKIPVIGPLGAAPDGTLLNINADTIAASLAAALQAEKLILATGAPGILEDINDPHSLVSYIDLAGLNQLRAAGALADGMLPKAKAIERAIEGGVKRVHVISFALPDSLLLEIFTNEGTGTLVVRSIAALTPEEQNAAP
ncbi:MAG: acetylglutamate kinase [Gammaproteobacteria bacterium]|jgi:acetylglutamate kinase|nr:acetylglutamate kinase [Gammaproteobacteria bacterium]